MKSEKIEKLVFEKLNLKAEPNSAGDLESYYLPLIVMLQVMLHYSIAIVIVVLWFYRLHSV